MKAPQDMIGDEIIKEVTQHEEALVKVAIGLQESMNDDTFFTFIINTFDDDLRARVVRYKGLCKAFSEGDYVDG